MVKIMYFFFYAFNLVAMTTGTNYGCPKIVIKDKLPGPS